MMRPFDFTEQIDIARANLQKAIPGVIVNASLEPKVDGEVLAFIRVKTPHWIQAILFTAREMEYRGLSLSEMILAEVEMERFMNSGRVANTNKEWQPIETAPRDGTGLLLCKARDATGRLMPEDAWPYYVQVAFWVEEEEKWIVDCNRIYDLELDFTPTHWMPLPANPLLSPTEIGCTVPNTTKSTNLEFTPYSGVDVGDIKGK